MGKVLVSEVAALQGALAAEYAAQWGYDVVGARSAVERQQQSRDVQAAHHDRAAALATLLRQRGTTPDGPAASYDLPFPVRDRAAAWRLAVHLEDGVAAAWRYLLGQTTDQGIRRTAVDALTASAVQAVRWRTTAGIKPTTEPFPGR